MSLINLKTLYMAVTALFILMSTMVTLINLRFNPNQLRVVDLTLSQETPVEILTSSIEYHNSHVDPVPNIPEPVQVTKETTVPNIPEPVQVTKETTVPNIPEPVQVTKETIVPNIPEPVQVTKETIVPNILEPVQVTKETIVPNIPEPVQVTKETTILDIPNQVQVTKETTIPNIPEPVQVTKKTIPTPKPTEVAPVNSPWLEYRANWNGQDLLLDINDETGLLTLLPEYRPRMLSKLHHPLTEVYLPFKERFDIMDKYCDELKIPSTQSMMLYDSNRVFFNDSYESVHCDMPKASSRVWKRKYAQMHNITRQWDPEPPPEERMIFSVGYHMIPHNMTAKRIQTYTKTLVTRHPFKRLISGFNDKFSNHPLYVDGLSKEIIKKLYLKDLPANESDFFSLINSKYSYMDTDTKSNISFQYKRLKDSHLKLITLMEFLQYLIVTWEEKGNARSFDQHWRPITEHCLPCSFTYDILIEHDKIAEESQMVLDYLQRNNKQNPPLNFKEYYPQTSVNVCNNAFKTVPMEMRKKVFEIYKNDFALFGYKTDLASDNNIC